MQQVDGYVEGDGPCRITHYHVPGLYGREMWMPADCLITGKIHKTEHICILSKGKVTVANGGESVTYEAPATIISKVGAKRAVYAHEESVWTNFHATELSDPEEIEEEIIAKSFEELDGLLARSDYDRFLIESDLTECDVQAITHLTDVIPCDGKYEIAESLIEGFGLFPKEPIQAGEIIAPALWNGVKTEAGRYTNHSGKPNARMVVRDDGNIDLVAIERIVSEEITTDYRETLKAQGMKRIS